MEYCDPVQVGHQHLKHCHMFMSTNTLGVAGKCTCSSITQQLGLNATVNIYIDNDAAYVITTPY